MEAPELIAPSVIHLIGWVAIVFSASTLVIATLNFREAYRRMQMLGEMDDRQHIIAMGILREGSAGFVVAPAAAFVGYSMVFGDFQLVNDLFSYAFLMCVFSGVMMRFTLGTTAMRDRRLLDRLSAERVEQAARAARAEAEKSKRRGKR